MPVSQVASRSSDNAKHPSSIQSIRENMSKKQEYIAIADQKTLNPNLGTNPFTLIKHRRRILAQRNANLSLCIHQ